MTRPVKEETVKISLPIRTAIHAEMVVRAREDRRSLINLINLVLEKWVREAKAKGGDNA